MSDKSIGIGELLVTADREDVIKTYSLSSCIAVVIWDHAGIGGMAHIALPDSSIDAEMRTKPVGYYADKAIPVLLQKMGALSPSLRKVWIKLVGGADSNCEEDHFMIGRRNIIAVKRMLWERGMGVIAEDIGGKASRTVEFGISDGSLAVISGGKRRMV